MSSFHPLVPELILTQALAGNSQGQFESAWNTLEYVLAITREIEDRQNEAETLLSEVRMLLGWRTAQAGRPHPPRRLPEQPPRPPSVILE